MLLIYKIKVTIIGMYLQVGKLIGNILYDYTLANRSLKRQSVGCYLAQKQLKRTTNTYPLQYINSLLSRKGLLILA